MLVMRNPLSRFRADKYPRSLALFPPTSGDLGSSDSASLSDRSRTQAAVVLGAPCTPTLPQL